MFLASCLGQELCFAVYVAANPFLTGICVKSAYPDVLNPACVRTASNCMPLACTRRVIMVPLRDGLEETTVDIYCN